MSSRSLLALYFERDRKGFLVSLSNTLKMAAHSSAEQSAGANPRLVWEIGRARVVRGRRHGEPPELAAGLDSIPFEWVALTAE